MSTAGPPVTSVLHSWWCVLVLRPSLLAVWQHWCLLLMCPCSESGIYHNPPLIVQVKCLLHPPCGRHCTPSSHPSHTGCNDAPLGNHSGQWGWGTVWDSCIIIQLWCSLYYCCDWPMSYDIQAIHWSPWWLCCACLLRELMWYQCLSMCESEKWLLSNIFSLWKAWGHLALKSWVFHSPTKAYYSTACMLPGRMANACNHAMLWLIPDLDLNFQEVTVNKLNLQEMIQTGLQLNNREVLQWIGGTHNMCV